MPEHDLRARPIIEVFGAVFQGEGAMAGIQTMFVRTGGCDDRCAWCDTLYSVDPDEVKKNAIWMAPETILEALQESSPTCRVVTISGGNPCIWDLTRLVHDLKSAGYYVAIETQGTLFKVWLKDCDMVTISPKPPSSGNITNLQNLQRHFIPHLEVSKMNLKVVVFNDEDYEYAADVAKMFPHIETYFQPGTTQFDITPRGGPVDSLTALESTREDILERTEWLWTKVLSDPSPSIRKVRVLPQIHSLVYGQKRGV